MGLVSPAVVANSIVVEAPELPRHTDVTYFLDDQPAGHTLEFPYRLRGSDPSSGYSLAAWPPGLHHLRAEARLLDHTILHSNTVALEVIPSINARFSSTLTSYENQPGAHTKSVDGMLRETSTAGARLSDNEILARKSILAMYMNWGIDPSIDNENDESQVLLSRTPKRWAPGHRGVGRVPLSLLFSPDAPFYQAIPRLWPRVQIPAGYIRQVQLNTNQAGDGIGFGEMVARPGDPALMVRSQWYGNTATLRTFSFRMSPTWAKSLPSRPSGDLHMIFVDPTSNEFVSSYKTSLDPKTGGPSALYATSPVSLDTLGDHGGSIAAHFAELPTMLQPGEATDPTQPIRHALGGPVARTWAARVYPANARDAGVRTSPNSCTGKGFTNTGVVPYGGVIQLDPQLNLTELGLTLPARRILEAIQTYGYYVEDYGCSDLDIYTAVSEAEFDPFGGLWGYNHHGVGVQNEIQKVLVSSKLYVVAPLVKKE